MAALITTVDNPYDPITEFYEWYTCDRDLARKGNYTDTCSLLASLAHTSPLFSEELNDWIREDTIDDIIRFDVENKYKKIVI